MSKKFTAGCDEVFDGFDPYTVTYNSSDEMGEKGVYYTLSNYESGTEESHIKQYVNNISETNEISPMVKTRTGSPDVNLTVPNNIVVGQEYGLRLNNPSSQFNIINSLEVELPDAVFDLFDHFITDINVFMHIYSFKNTDDVLQDFVVVNMAPIDIEGNRVCKTRLVKTEGCQDIEFTVDKNSSGGSFLYYRGEATACVLSNIKVEVLSKLTSKVLDTYLQSITNYPHKPILEKVIRRGAIYLKITNNTKCHGNIYINGSPTPVYEYSIPVGNSIEFELPSGAGAYTANVVSETVLNPGGRRYAYGELSDTLIIEKETFNATLSFNEYTGILSCITDEHDAVYNYQLNKLVDGRWKILEHSGNNQFQITESGTYKINILTRSNLFEFNVSPESITVKTTLDAPTAYSDPAFPSQLGFDEVENANIYDVYRVSEDGEDELVATISQNNIISRIMRKEKMFIVIPNDEVKNV